MKTRFGKATPYDAYIIKVKWIIAALFSLIVLLTFLLVFLGFESSQPKAQIAEKPESEQPKLESVLVPVAIPSIRIENGQRINRDMLQIMHMPQDQLNSDVVHLDYNETVVGMYATDVLLPGIPIQRTKLQINQPSTTIPIPSGMRAKTITVDAESGVEWHVQPSSRVDVLLNYVNRAGEKAVKNIVLFARVLSLDGSPQPNQVASGKHGVKTVTLLVSLMDAQRLALAEQYGKLSLVLRSEMDNGEIDEPSVEITGSLLFEEFSNQETEVLEGRAWWSHNSVEGKQLCSLKNLQWKCETVH